MMYALNHMRREYNNFMWNYGGKKETAEEQRRFRDMDKHISKEDYESLYLCSNVDGADISIPTTEQRSNIGYYNIEIKWNPGEEPLKVSKRFSQFDELQAVMLAGSDSQIGANLDLPKKDMNSDTYMVPRRPLDDATLEERRDKLEQWLKERVQLSCSASAADALRDHKHWYGTTKTNHAKRVRMCLYQFLEIKGKPREGTPVFSTAVAPPPAESNGGGWGWFGGGSSDASPPPPPPPPPGTEEPAAPIQNA